MSDGRIFTLAGSIKTVQYSLTTDPVSIKTIVGTLTGTWPMILEAELLAHVTAGTDRANILFGGDAASMYGFIPAGEPKVFSIRDGNVFLASVSGTQDIVIAAALGVSQ